MQYYKEEPHDAVIANSESFKSKIRITGKNLGDGDKRDVEIAVPLKHSSYLGRTVEVPLINCEINLILTFCRLLLPVQLVQQYSK